MPLALILNKGKPEISLISKIVPLDKLLLIENNWPWLPSKEIELSERTLNTIGAFDWPTNESVGAVDPVPPNTPVENNKLPETVAVPPMVAALFTVNVFLKVTAPVTPMPPETSNVLPMPTLFAKYPAPDTFNVDLKVVDPVTPKPPVISVAPWIPRVDAKNPAPVTFRVDESVAAPVTPRVDLNVAAPVTPKPPVISVAP